ncbi:MAG: TonB-dependent receptor plug domain-containing protein [Cytophagales bacterium]|nr:TonB-dependent receptor plug domain-containing protein [Cytophagales bacterium]MDW8383614.1 TonB-dependent receptor plug domain-containing protein [Flammeovirgaceae bacterium]
MKWIITVFCGISVAFSQTIRLKGTVYDDESALDGVVIYEIYTQKFTFSEKGSFTLEIPPTQNIGLVFRLLGYQTDTLYISASAIPALIKKQMIKETKILSDVEILAPTQEREQAGTIILQPRTLQNIPSPFLDFNQALMSIGLGVSGNNELSSAYSVRGGNFDENLVYVNGMIVYRPFLVRAGEQEGLSFINPDMVKSVEFSAGGWQPKYGDKLSSVLNVEYKQPKRFSASFNAGLLGGSFTVENTIKRVSTITSLRHKSAKYLFQFGGLPDIDGEYFPYFTDVQNYTHVVLSPLQKTSSSTTLGILTNYAANRYEVFPQARETTFGTLFENFRLNVDFDGKERMKYNTFQQSIRFQRRFSHRFQSDWIVSGMTTREREFFNTEAFYAICRLENPTLQDNNKCISTRGIASSYQVGRNILEAQVFATENRNLFVINEKFTAQFGLRYEQERIQDFLNEYQLTDSVDFIKAVYSFRSQASLYTDRTSGYGQLTFSTDTFHTLTVGMRFNYGSLNKQLLLSPRVQYSFRPHWRRDVVFKTALGFYAQPPFYREMRDPLGNVNTQLRAQQSFHAIVGMDYHFWMWRRIFRFIAETYYKNLWNVVAYDIDNVRLRYYGNNQAIAYAYGADIRINGEFVRELESWFNISYLQTRENVGFDHRNWIRRPSDQRITVSVFFQDHILQNPSWRMNIRILYGSGLPFGPPNQLQYRQFFEKGTRYFRTDLGFSKVVWYRSKQKVNHRSLESCLIGLDVLNLLNVRNTVSFTWLRDFDGNQYGVPNTLTQRFINFRIFIRY